jgi:hypothetical protein
MPGAGWPFGRGAVALGFGPDGGEAYALGAPGNAVDSGSIAS